MSEADTRRSPNDVIMLSQRHRWWTNIKPSFGQRLAPLSARYTPPPPPLSQHDALEECYFNAGPPSTMMDRHLTNIQPLDVMSVLDVYTII